MASSSSSSLPAAGGGEDPPLDESQDTYVSETSAVSSREDATRDASSSAISAIDPAADAGMLLSSTPPPPPPIQDRSLVVDLHSHLNDTDLADVTLCGTDNKTVVAVRSILAMRSPFFKSLFFGTFQESTSDTVKLGYSSLVLRAVVEYCYTDEIKTAFENLAFEETARSMVGLVAAGNYFSLGGLQNKAYRLTCLMMDEYPALACAVLDEVSVSMSNNTIETSELGRVALGIIRLRTESALLPPDTYGLGVRSLNKTAMEQVMADGEIQAHELSLFYCLKKWAEYTPPDAVNTDERHRIVRQELAQHIDFSKIEPSDLATIVQDSNLVPTELLLDAYRTQALQAERKGLISCQMRSTLKEATSVGNIVVQGAGLSAVNGTYTSCNALHDPLKYSRRGNLPGLGQGIFVLQTFVLQDDSKKWFLSYCQDEPTVCDTRTRRSTTPRVKPLDLYSSPVLSETDPPPMQKWSSVTAGHEKLRALQNRKFLRGSQTKHGHHHPHTTTTATLETSSSSLYQYHHGDDYSYSDDGVGVGDPPPICIWLPHEHFG